MTKPSKDDKKARRRKVRDRQAQIAGDVATAVFGSAPRYRVHSVEEREDGSMRVGFDGASEFVVFGPDEARGLQVSPGDKIQVMALVTRVVEKPKTFDVSFTGLKYHVLDDPTD